MAQALHLPLLGIDSFRIQHMLQPWRENRVPFSLSYRTTRNSAVADHNYLCQQIDWWPDFTKHVKGDTLRIRPIVKLSF